MLRFVRLLVRPSPRSLDQAILSLRQHVQRSDNCHALRGMPGFGLAFIKGYACFPYPAMIWVSGHEYGTYVNGVVK